MDTLQDSPPLPPGEESAWIGAMLQMLGDGVSFVGPDGRVRYTNSSSRRITGRSPDTSRPLAEQAERYGLRDASGRPLAPDETPVARALRGECVGPIELLARRPDGTDYWVQVTSRPVWAADGSLLGVLNVFRDVTEQKRVAAAVAESQRFLQSVIDAVPALLYVKDTAHRFTLVNRALARYVGDAPEAMIGRSDRDYFTPERCEQFEADEREVLAGRTVLRAAEQGVRRWGGEPHWITTVKAPLHDAKGRVIGLVGAGIDVTDRVKAEQEAEKLRDQLTQVQKMEAVGRLAGAIAHSFKNALQVIRGQVSILERSVDSPEARAAVEAIAAAAARAVEFSQDLLGFVRSAPRSERPVDLNALVGETAVLLRGVLGPLITLRRQLDPDLPLVLGDPSHLQQVLLNLCLNARDALPHGGEVVLRTRATVLDESEAARHPGLGPGAHAVLEVSDSGIGMSEDTRARAFEPFYTTKPAGQGSGLGLTIVYQIVTQHRGSIAVESQEGRGTTVRIHLPAVREEIPGGEPAGESNGLAARQAERVLVAEDEALVRELLVQQLRSAGFQVIEAESGTEALALAREHGLDLAVIDLSLPGVTGLHLYERLSALRPELPVVFTSGHVDTSLPPHLLARANVVFLEKPYRQQELLRALQRVRRAAKPGSDQASPPPGDGVAAHG